MGSMERVAVLGAGVMGAGIAAHLANAGVECLLFDLVSDGDGGDRSAVARQGIKGALKSRPAAFFVPGFARRITPCNYDDDADRLATCDWIVEVVVERLDIKKKVFAWVAEHRKPGSIVSSNTSGIPLADLVEGLPQDMVEHFLITHFFNPVRYMRLLEIVQGPATRPDVVAQVADFVDRRLGKGVVYAKDTPNFIANRIGTYGMASVFRYMKREGLSVEQVDAIFGPAMGRPKSAVFRTADLVGLDTLKHVFSNLHTYLEHDEERDIFALPEVVDALIEHGQTGQKAGAGFYKKVKVDGASEILVLDTETLTYRPKEKVRYPCIGAARKAETLPEKLCAMVYGDDEASEAAWSVLADTLIYTANRIPEIADDVVNIDRAMRWGFGWSMGPFETWDAIGLSKSVERMQAEGRSVPAWVTDLIASGHASFYSRSDNGEGTYTSTEGATNPLSNPEGVVFLPDLKAQGQEIQRNASASLFDLGEGVLGLEFHAKLNALDDQIIEQYGHALDRLDAGEFDALVVGNQDDRAFCAGANIAMILMAASQDMFEEIEQLIDRLQALTMRAKYSEKPVVTAPFGLTLGGGCEVALHSSATVAHSELYMGLVEAGVGLIPAAGGCKESIIRMMGDIPQDVDYDPNPFIQKVFERIGMAKVTRSAEEARNWGYLRPNDRVVLNPDRVLAEAHATAAGLARAGYTPPARRTVKLPGASGRAAIELFLFQMREGGYATEHDVTVGRHLANILTGGDIPAGTAVSEQHLLDLEREAFLSLCGEEKTRMRMLHMLQTNKPLRN
jgi:3-hydroxyacyl-CoA dehydrogenase